MKMTQSATRMTGDKQEGTTLIQIDQAATRTHGALAFAAATSSAIARTVKSLLGLAGKAETARALQPARRILPHLAASIQHPPQHWGCEHWKQAKFE
jgi:hypothetical protein